MLQKKDDEIILLSKAKFDLQADLTFERSKKSTKQGNKKFTKEMQLEKYEEIINLKNDDYNSSNSYIRKELILSKVNKSINNEQKLSDKNQNSLNDNYKSNI